MNGHCNAQNHAILTNGVVNHFKGHQYSKIHAEVAQNYKSKLTLNNLLPIIKSFINEFLINQNCEQILKINDFHENDTLKSNLVSLEFYSDNESKIQFAPDLSNVRFYIFKLDSSGGQQEEMDEEERINAATFWTMPSLDFQGLWPSLIYDTDIKQSLLNYVETTVLLAQHNIDQNLISWNKVVLLHGPPGTGKTSLCKALAQKLSIRMVDKFQYTELIEVNSHSLFSKWFSESGKLVQKMFEKIHEIAENPKALVIVLIDEVESLAAARKSSGNEPSDAIRVVNAVLTQIDNLKRFPNVLILTTSNITGSIDLAFVDRADIKKFIGMPSHLAVFSMLKGSLEELMNKKLLAMSSLNSDPEKISTSTGCPGNKLLDLSRQCQGLSGRTIRKLPFLSYAKIVKTYGTDHVPDIDTMLYALNRTIQEQFDDRSNLKKD